MPGARAGRPPSPRLRRARERRATAQRPIAPAPTTATRRPSMRPPRGRRPAVPDPMHRRGERLGEAGDLEIEAGRHRHEAACRHDDRIGEAPDRQRRAVAARARTTGEARLAAAAGAGEGRLETHPVAGSERPGGVAHLADDAGDLVPVRSGQLARRASRSRGGPSRGGSSRRRRTLQPGRGRRPAVVEGARSDRARGAGDRGSTLRGSPAGSTKHSIDTEYSETR